MIRRVKCPRCGGDWGMHNGVHTIVEWCPGLEQLHRDAGFQILEPLPAWRSFPVEPLTWSELMRAARWPGLVAATASEIVGHTAIAAGMGWLAPLAAIAVGCGVALLLGRSVIERAYERKCNTLQA